MAETNDNKQSAIERAREYGIDISLIESNLRLTPTERLQGLQEYANFIEQVRKTNPHLAEQARVLDKIRHNTQGVARPAG